MPPGAVSRYLFCTGQVLNDGSLALSARAPYRYVEHADTRRHVVQDGDTLDSLADRYFAPLVRAAGFWWAIADYQPEPILDPTITLDAGRLLYIPSVRVLTDVILGEARRRDFH